MLIFNFMSLSVFNSHIVYLKIYVQVSVQILNVKLPDFYVYTCVATTSINIEALHHVRKFLLKSVASSLPSQGNHLNWR